MLIKINSALNGSINEIPTNIVSEALEEKLGLIHNQDDLIFKLFGDSHVGKTSFLKRYLKNQFSNNYRKGF